MGRFLKKRSTDYFENGIFFQQEVERRYFKSKSRSKKAPCEKDKLEIFREQKIVFPVNIYLFVHP
jgi:hypothetical protein